MIESSGYDQERAEHTNHVLKRLSDTPLTDKVDFALRHPETWWDFSDTLEVTREQANTFRKGNTKRLTEISVSGVPACLAFLASALCGAAAYYEDRHNPLFPQERLTADGTRSTFYKVRSMKPGAETMISKEEIFDKNAKGIPDPRVTKTGRVLRTVDIDEAPQIVQVVAEAFTGEKRRYALIGPRVISEDSHECLKGKLGDEKFDEWEKGYDVMPGIISLQGVMDKKGHKNRLRGVRYDNFYATHAHLGLDMYILWRAAPRKILAGIERKARSFFGYMKPSV